MTLRKFLTLAYHHVPDEVSEQLLRKQTLKLRLNEALDVSEKLSIELVEFVTEVLERRCRNCGCTQDDCSQCIEKTGHPCTWVEEDLCSACQHPKKYSHG